MKPLALLLAVIIGWWAGVANGQLAVQAKTDKDTFLLYEPIPVTVGLRNLTGRTIQLTGSADTPWLNFVIADEGGSLLGAAGELKTEESVLIPPGQTVSRKVDILPLYDLRRRGNFTVQARVEQGGIQAISMPVKIVIVNGRELWTQTVALPVADQKEDEYRTYSLIARRGDKEDLLHICVKDEPHQLVYGVIGLGGYIPLAEPEARVDRNGHLHVLYPGGPRAYGYVHVDPQARIIERAVYADRSSKPRLVINDGAVSVRGGEQTEPRAERVMTQEELNPPPPPPAPPKKKSWWPFGKRTTSETPER